MGLYLYCVLPPEVGPPAALRGLHDAPVRLHAVGALACWVSALAAPPEPSLPGVRRHNDVVEAALALGTTPLPVRFGQWLEDDAALEAVLRERAAAWAEALERLRHTVEYGVRVLDPGLAHAFGDLAPAGGTGTAYMLALAQHVATKRELESRGREIAMRVRAVSGSLVRQERIEALPTRHGLVSIAHLVERDCDVQYRAGLDAVRRAYPDLRFLTSGPWPPYSFAP